MDDYKPNLLGDLVNFLPENTQEGTLHQAESFPRSYSTPRPIIRHHSSNPIDSIPSSIHQDAKAIKRPDTPYVMPQTRQQYGRKITKNLFAQPQNYTGNESVESGYPAVHRHLITNFSPTAPNYPFFQSPPNDSYQSTTYGSITPPKTVYSDTYSYYPQTLGVNPFRNTTPPRYMNPNVDPFTPSPVQSTNPFYPQTPTTSRVQLSPLTPPSPNFYPHTPVSRLNDSFVSSPFSSGIDAINTSQSSNTATNVSPLSQSVDTGIDMSCNEAIPYSFTPQVHNFNEYYNSYVQQYSRPNFPMSEASYVPGVGLMPTPFRKNSKKMCSFCRKNGESAMVFMSHALRKKSGKKSIVVCPILRSLVCQTCGASGDNAHTYTYCPVLRSKNQGPIESTTLILKNTRNMSNGKKRF